MATKTQGTQLFVMVPTIADPTKYEVLTIAGMTSFNPGGNPADQIDVTTLEDDSKEFVNGLRTPAQSTFNINADPRIDSHVRLHQLSESDSDEKLNFVVGWSDGKSIPKINAAGDDLELPNDRSWFRFKGFVADFPFTFEGNSVVKTEVPITRSGGSQWIRKGSQTEGSNG